LSSSFQKNLSPGVRPGSNSISTSTSRRDILILGLIHDYDDIDHDIVWEIVTADLPLLALELSRSLSDQ
jgi:hypothetical protein